MLMDEPPDLALETIRGALLAGFGIRVAGLGFLPVGNDSDSWSYRVDTDDGPSLFLKVRTGPVELPGALVPHHLRRQGVPSILAPLPTAAGAAAVQAGGFALTLYPMVDGRPGAEAGLDPDQWRQLGAVARQVHRVPVPPALAGVVRRESFRPTRRDLIPELEAALAGRARDPVAAELADLWQARREVIGELVDQADARGRRLERLGLPLVLCHADLHTWNVLVEADRRVWLVDWDEATLAPKERDLMFVVGGIADGLLSPGDTESFFRGYGETSLHWPALAYYRYAWAVQDIAAYAERALLLPGLGTATRRAAVHGLVGLFAPGNIVELAMAGGERW